MGTSSNHTLVAGLGAWALSPERSSDLISLNKEGIVSCSGYWSLYLVGAALAHGMQVRASHAVPSALCLGCCLLASLRP